MPMQERRISKDSQHLCFFVNMTNTMADDVLRSGSWDQSARNTVRVC